MSKEVTSMHFLRLETCLNIALPKHEIWVLTDAFSARIGGGEHKHEAGKVAGPHQ